VAPPAAPPAAGTRPRIVLDAGHGGIDPGAVRDGVAEKDVALAFARALASALTATGRYDVLLTRNDDRFVPLDDRVAFGRAAGADLFLSLHANVVTEGAASGATLYLPADTASDTRAAALAARENGSDAAAGLPARMEDDLAEVLMDMQRPVTRARGQAAAEALLPALDASTGMIRSRPLRAADFRVLRAPDMPSVLLELGFLSDPQDRARMTAPGWRTRVAAALVPAIDRWVREDAAFLALMAD
ncbi:MAG: N-acetylmuramoyl-L-alanine amidase, partial [Pseudomonadota bacterium]